MLAVADGGLKESVPCFTAESAVQATPGRPRLNSKKTANRLMSFRVAIMTSVTSLFFNVFRRLKLSSYLLLPDLRRVQGLELE
jgi:hypothetical protein